MKVAWGLLAAWVLHDLEELATLPRWSTDAPVTLAGQLPAPVLRALPMSRTEAATAIGLVGAVMTVASARGARTGGQSALFQSALTGFGLHAGTHIAQSVILRRYTPGLITTPLVVIPYALWARRQMRDIPKATPSPALTVALAAAVPLAHAIARLPRLAATPVAASESSR